MPGIESQKAFDLMEQRFPGATADGATARVVFIAPGGEKVTAAENRQAIEKAVTGLGDGAQVAGAVAPFQAKTISEDGSTAVATVTYKVGPNDLTDASRTHLERALDQARDSGLTVEAGGTALADNAGPGGTAEVIGISIAAVVLLITFGSLAAAGLPLLTAVIGIGVSMATTLILSRALGPSTTTGTLAMMLGLAVGIDYALFVVSRYREERAKGRAPQEAAGLAAGTAGSAVVFAGLTVVIALAGLAVVGVPMLTKMGLAAAGAIVVTVLIALTLVPALLGFWPNAVLTRRARKSGRIEESGDTNGGTRWAGFVLRRPIPVLLLGVVGLGALALPAAGLQLGMPGDEAKAGLHHRTPRLRRARRGLRAGFNGHRPASWTARAPPTPRVPRTRSPKRSAPRRASCPSPRPASTTPVTPPSSPSAETGIDVEIIGTVGTYTSPRHVFAYDDGEVRQEFSICFLARPVAGQLAVSEETTDVRWFELAEIDALP